MQQNASRSWLSQSASQIRNILCDEHLCVNTSGKVCLPVLTLPRKHPFTFYTVAQNLHGLQLLLVQKPPTELSHVRCPACSRAWRHAVFVYREQTLCFTGQFCCLCFLSFYVPWKLHITFISIWHLSADLRPMYTRKPFFFRTNMVFIFIIHKSTQLFFRYLVWKDEFNIEGAALFRFIVTKVDSLQIT